jgi:hypothetical protein
LICSGSGTTEIFMGVSVVRKEAGIGTTRGGS